MSQQEKRKKKKKDQSQIEKEMMAFLQAMARAAVEQAINDVVSVLNTK